MNFMKYLQKFKADASRVITLNAADLYTNI